MVVKSGVGASVIPPSNKCEDPTNKFSYEFKVDSITPSKGSVKGGTVLTITGVNFNKEKDKARNQVFIGDYNTMCDVIHAESSKT